MDAARSRGPGGDRLSEILSSELLSRLLLLAGIAAVAGVGLAQYAKDGSFWRDEAAVAESLLALSPLEFFGRPLEGMQSFPRLYLSAIAGVQALLGYETWSLRLLPQLFFLAGSASWILLLYLRFRRAPLVLALGIALILLVAPWFTYGAMLKSYSFDLFAATLPFLVPDRVLDDAFQRGRRRTWLVALALPGLLSYPYVFAILGRLGGYGVAWLRDGRPGLAAAGRLVATVALAVGSVAVCAGLLWWIDVRHTAEVPGLQNFWASCILGDAQAETGALVDRLAVGWYDGRTEFGRKRGLGELAVWPLRVAVWLGVVRIAIYGLYAGDGPRTGPGWGSRSLGFALMVAGLLVASPILGYPICAGRLTLFVLPALQVVLLEGVDQAGEWGRRRGLGSVVALAVGVALLAVVAPVAVRDARHQVDREAPDDVRPLLAWIRSDAPDLPVLTTHCTRKALETLPEGPGDLRILYIEEGGGLEAARAGGAWVLYVRNEYCDNAVKNLKLFATRWDRRDRKGDSSFLVRAAFPPPP